jgi:hypothetical protein
MQHPIVVLTTAALSWLTAVKITSMKYQEVKLIYGPVMQGLAECGRAVPSIARTSLSNSLCFMFNL